MSALYPYTSIRASGIEGARRSPGQKVAESAWTGERFVDASCHWFPQMASPPLVMIWSIPSSFVDGLGGHGLGLHCE